jgi:hypothetical protein
MRSNEPICSFMARRANDVQAAKKPVVSRAGYPPITDILESGPQKDTLRETNQPAGRAGIIGEK